MRYFILVLFVSFLAGCEDNVIYTCHPEVASVITEFVKECMNRAHTPGYCADQATKLYCVPGCVNNKQK